MGGRLVHAHRVDGPPGSVDLPAPPVLRDPRVIDPNDRPNVALGADRAELLSQPFEAQHVGAGVGVQEVQRLEGDAASAQRERAQYDVDRVRPAHHDDARLAVQGRGRIIRLRADHDQGVRGRARTDRGGSSKGDVERAVDDDP